VHSGDGEQRGGFGAAGDTRQVVAVHVGHSDRAAGVHALGDQPVGVVQGELTGRVGGTYRLAGVGGGHGESTEHRGTVPHHGE
jgi:hypothetical protein